MPELVQSAPATNTARDPARLAKLAEKARSRRRAKAAKEAKAEAKVAALVDGPAADAPAQAADAAGTEAPAAQAAKPSEADVQAFREPCVAIWSGVAAMLGAEPALRLSQAEVATLAEASLPVAAKYLPQVAASPEATLAAMVLMVFAPKLITWKREQAARAAELSRGQQTTVEA